jgi:hypothetical protein
MEQHPGAFEMLAIEIRKDRVRNAEQRRLVKAAEQPGRRRFWPRFRRSPRPDASQAPAPAPTDFQPA